MPSGHAPWDAVVVGAGHNGLTAAAYLARAGLRTLVLERREIVGGCCVTEEIHPGCRASTTSYIASMLRPEVIHELALASHGLRMVPCDPALYVPFPDGSYLAWWSDPGRTVSEMRAHSERDAGRSPPSTRSSRILNHVGDRRARTPARQVRRARERPRPPASSRCRRSSPRTSIACSTGEGQHIDASLLEAGIALVDLGVGSSTSPAAAFPQPIGSAHRMFAPYQAIRCSDGYITRSALGQHPPPGRPVRSIGRIPGAAAIVRSARPTTREEPQRLADRRAHSREARASRPQPATTASAPCGAESSLREVVRLDPHVVSTRHRARVGTRPPGSDPAWRAPGSRRSAVKHGPPQLSASTPPTGELGYSEPSRALARSAGGPRAGADGGRDAAAVRERTARWRS